MSNPESPAGFSSMTSRHDPACLTGRLREVHWLDCQAGTGVDLFYSSRELRDTLDPGWCTSSGPQQKKMSPSFCGSNITVDLASNTETKRQKE